jgi:hypothetical protein
MVRKEAFGRSRVDETFIGSKGRNMHVVKRERRITGTGCKDKTAVMGILEGGGRSARPSFRTAEKSNPVRGSPARGAGTALYTAFLLSYERLVGNTLMK